MKKSNLILYLIIILAAVGTRLIPHLWNFAPVTAIAIFAAVYLPKKQAVALPLVVRFVSDLIIGFFYWPLMLAVYLAHLFGVAAGLWIRRKKTVLRVVSAPVYSALVFFFVTNFAWFYPSYSNDLSGILLAYQNGLPFFRGTLLGDVVYTIALIGGYEAAKYAHFRIKNSKLKAAA